MLYHPGGDEKCKRVMRSLKMLEQCTKAMLGSLDEDGLLRSVCAILVDTAGYSLAWVGYAQDDPDKTVKPVAICGSGEDYVLAAKVAWSDTLRGRGPTGTAIRTKRTSVITDIVSDPSYAPWRSFAEEHGFCSSISLPLSLNGGPGGALNVYSCESGGFDTEEISQLEGLANNLAYGVTAIRARRERIRAERALRESCAKLHSTLDGVVKAMAAVTELRDRYTAGHQQRVGELAEAIAKKMGLPHDEVEGVTIAAGVHDLGKVYVPSEILSKPGNLSTVEFDLVKVHAQAGYNILKTIEFPWPIAETILQHHERMDGSGYPQGLVGDKILMSARIVAVADVVEAMSCFRPYRPARGIEEALKEIASNRSTLYDPDVADACSEVFAEDLYRFPQTFSGDL